MCLRSVRENLTGSLSALKLPLMLQKVLLLSMNRSDPEAKPVSMQMHLGFDPKYNNKSVFKKKKQVIQTDQVTTNPKLKKLPIEGIKIHSSEIRSFCST